MALLDSPLAKVASTLTRTFGGTGTLTLEADGSYNTATGASSPSETTFSVRPTPGGAAELRMFGDSVVEQGDRTCIIAASEVTGAPAPGAAKLSWLGKVWRVEQVQPLNTGGADAAYVLLLRG